MDIVFSKSWFRKHQKKLLWFANTKFGKYVLRIHGDRSSLGNNKIVKIEPNAITWVKEAREDSWDFCTEFRTKDKFSARLYYAFKPFWWLIHFVDWLALDRFEFAQQFSFGFLTLTQYPGSIGTDNPCDGTTERTGAISETYATIRAGAGTAPSTAFIYTFLQASAVVDQYSRVRRGIMLFDTAALTAAATISAATLSLYEYAGAVGTGLGTTSVNIVASTPASTNAIVAADYAQLGSTSFSAIAFASISLGAYNNFALNGSGVAAISKTAISKFGLRDTWDMNGSFTGIWSLGATTYCGFYSASEAGTSKDPKLVVTYTLPASGGINPLLFF